MYNIKKMLPRLIVAALLINVSYYICGIAVDISNILGQTLISTIHALVPPQMPADIDGWQSLVTMLVYLTPAAAVAGPAVVNMHFAALAPIALMAAIALLVTVLVLLLRQALIVLFIVISPLAFAAMVLPGTNNLFEKWRSNFTTLLLLYPAVSIVFGGAYLASQAIMRVGAARIDTDPVQGPLLMIMALGVQTIPLAVTPIILALGGGFLSQFAGATKSKLPFNAAQKKVQKWSDNRKLVSDANKLRNPNSKWRFRSNAVKKRYSKEAKDASLDKQLGKTRENAAVQAGNNESMSPFEKMRDSGKIPGRDGKTKGEKYLESLAGTDDDSATRRAKNHLISMKVKLHADEVRAGMAELEHDPEISFPDMVEMAATGFAKNSGAAAGAAAGGGAAAGAAAGGAAGGSSGGGNTGSGGAAGRKLSDTIRESAILKIASSGDAEGIIKLIKSSSDMTVQQRITLVKAIRASGAGDKIPFLADEQSLKRIQNGEVDESNFSEKVVVNSINQGWYSPENISTLDKHAANELKSAIQYANGDKQSELRSVITNAFADVKTNSKIGAQRDILVDISVGRT